mgnify:FL=1
MDDKPKKRGRKLGSKKEVPDVKPPPKKRGRKPKKKIITNENPIFADDNLNMEDLIIKLNNDKSEHSNSLSFLIDEHEEINFKKKSLLCWNCCHEFTDQIHGVPISFNSGVFHTVGDLCSIECISRYAVDNMSNDIYTILPLINLYNNKINKNNNKVKLAPNRLLLDIFGGNMSIDEYRNNNILYDLKLPIIIPTNYNINKYNLKNNNNITDLKLYRKNKLNKNNNNITKKLNID